MSEAESRAREKDRERAHLVGQLGEQNQRLTGELEAASRREEELTRQVEELRAQFQDKRETMRDHVMHLETLKDEVLKHPRLFLNIFCQVNLPFRMNANMSGTPLRSILQSRVVGNL